MSIIITISIIIFEISIVMASSRGTIRNSHPRRFVPHLLNCRIAFFVVEMISLLINTALAAQSTKLTDMIQCPDINSAVVLARIIVSVTWFSVFTFALAVIIYFDPCHLYSSKLVTTNNDHHPRRSGMIVLRRWQLTQSVWEKRFKMIFCFAGSDDLHQNAYREMAEIFAHVIQDTNLVVSDVAAGFVLLQKRHLQFERSVITSQTSISENSTTFDFHDPVEKELFSDAFHYIRFALGVYTWSIHMYMNPTCGSCQIISHLRCCCHCCCHCCQKHSIPPNIHDDNSCFCNLAGFIAMTTLDEMYVMYARFENDVYRAPFIVCLDHDKKSVVVSIRGTLSLHDLITDLTAYAELVHLSDWPRLSVHSGMYQAALWIKEHLEQDQVLENAFNKVPNYKLVLTGHSLGAGCAGILAILLKEKYPDLICYCFSPPGSLLNFEAATYTQSFITSVTLGHDFVGRFTVRTAYDLSRKVIKVLEKTKKPKYRIFLEGALETIGKCCGHHIVFTEEDYDESTEEIDLDSEPSPLLLSDPNEPLSFDIVSPNEHPPLLYPPGRIIHIVDTLQERNCFFAQRNLEAHWSKPDNFNTILISPDMLRDHFPDVLYRAMHRIWEKNCSQLDEISIQ